MSANDNTGIVRRLVEAWNQGNIDLLDALLASDFRHHAPIAPNVDREAYKQWFRDTHAAFPDLNLTIEDELTQGDRVTARWTFRGTHRHDLPSPLGTIPPSGKQIMTWGITIFQMSGGKITEDWHSGDDLGFLHQLGALPMPQQASV